jgi:hypothetical protein
MELVPEVVPRKSRFQAVAVMAAENIPVEVAFRALNVSTSGYYALKSRSPSQRVIRQRLARPWTHPAR